MNKNSILSIITALPNTNLLRTTLYLNIDRVKELYFQNGGLDTIEITDELNSQISGGIQAVVASVGSNISSAAGNRGQLNISPLLMAILMEEEKRRSNMLFDPSVVDVLPEGALLEHVADTHMVRPSDEVNTQTSGLPERVARLVEDERLRQVKEYEDLGLSRKMIVWATANRWNLASIASTEFLNPNSYSSYSQGLLGILGTLEKETSRVRFISPLWIWHQGFRISSADRMSSN